MKALACGAGVEIGEIVQTDLRELDSLDGHDILLANNILQFLGPDCPDYLARMQRATPVGGLNAVSVFTNKAEALANRTDDLIYRFAPGGLQQKYSGWRLFYYGEELRWSEPLNAMMSFARIVTTKP